MNQHFDLFWIEVQTTDPASFHFTSVFIELSSKYFMLIVSVVKNPG